MSYTSSYTGAQIDAGVAAANTAVQPAGSITGSSGSVKSNATTGVMQVTGPAAASTRVMTVPDANFTAARTDADQTFSGAQTFQGTAHNSYFRSTSSSGYERVFVWNDSNSGITSLIYGSAFAGTHAFGYPYAGLATLLNSTGNAFLIGNNENYPVVLQNNGVARLTLDTSGNAKVENGNLVIGTSGKGIDFSATGDATGMTSELLADYEEGTWTPVPYNLTVVGTPTYTGKYTKIGRMVHCIACIDSTTSTAASGGSTSFGGLPYTAIAVAGTGGGNAVFGDSNDYSQKGSGIIFTGNNRVYVDSWSATGNIVLSFTFYTS